jgi:hypothetical protein
VSDDRCDRIRSLTRSPVKRIIVAIFDCFPELVMELMEEGDDYRDGIALGGTIRNGHSVFWIKRWQVGTGSASGSRRTQRLPYR